MSGVQRLVAEEVVVEVPKWMIAQQVPSDTAWLIERLVARPEPRIVKLGTTFREIEPVLLKVYDARSERVLEDGTVCARWVARFAFPEEAS